MKIKTHKTHLPTIKHPKRLIIIIASIVVALGLITYGIFSYLTWRGLDEHSQTASTSLKTAIDDSLGTDEPSKLPSTQIDTLVSDFDKKYGDQPCDVSPLFSWQRFIPAVKDISNSCDQRFATAIGVIDALTPISQFLKDEKIAADLVTTTVTTTADPADYAATAAVWKSLTDATSLPTSADFKPITDKIKEIASTISVSYDKLVAANTAEDKVAFDLADSELKAAYGSIPTLATLASSQRDALIALFITAYDKL